MGTDETASPQRSSDAELEAAKLALAARDSEVRTLLARQAASVEVLKAISASPDDPQPVFELIARRARELCHAVSASVTEYDGALLHLRALDGFDSAAAEVLHRTYPRPANTDTINGRMTLSGQIIHIRDTDAYDRELPAVTNLAQTLRDLTRDQGVNSLLGVPLLRDGRVIGGFLLRRKEVGGFDDTEIALVQSFAEQAVIAICSATAQREVRTRTNDLQESLEQQTATAEVLQVINASPGNLAAVFATLLEKAASLCHAAYGSLLTFDGERFRTNAYHGHPDLSPAEAKWRTPEPGSALERIAAGERIVHILDVADTDAYRNRVPSRVHLVERYYARTALWVALRKYDAVVGAMFFYRREMRGFSNKEIALLENFAAQAVIAMENARLLTEQREALEQQTATAEVLKVISHPAFDLHHVFQTVAESAVRLCGADRAFIYRYDGDLLRMEVAHNAEQEFADWVANHPIRPGRHSGAARAALERRTVHIHDVLADPEYSFGAKDVSGLRTLLGVPILKGDQLLGVMIIYRLEVKPFTDKQIALVETFADQAAIAIEDARLINETREALEQQTATAEVLKVISRSAFDLQTVLDTLIASAVRLCNASRGEVFVRDGDLFRIRAHAGIHLPDLLEFLQQNPIKIGRETVTGRVAMTGEVHNIADILEDAEYEFPGVMEHRALRSRLGVPLVRDGRVEGVLHLSREESQPFTPRQVELVSTFADQAVIALENARLFSAVQERTRELTESLEQQTATAEVLKVISRSAFDLQSVLDTLIESAARLCNAQQGFIDLRDGDLFTPRAVTGVSNSFLDFLRDNPHRIGGKSAVGRVATTGAVVNIADVEQDPDYAYPGVLDHLSFRSVIGAPLLRDGNVEGVISLTRPQAEPFSPRQVELLATFADQAVIALENARLFGAVQARTGELAQSVAELQALEEVLRAVNSSLELQTVLSTIISRAVQLSHADEGMIYEFDPAEEVFVPKAAYGMSDERIARLRERRIRIGETYLGRSAVQRMPVRIDDVQHDQSTPEARELLQGIHAVLAIPLLREDKVIGGLVIRRSSEGAFEETTVKLLQTFATQSVLAIANARLFDEVQARTKELTESLEIQSATADVLKAISRSAFELDTVLETLTRSAANLCDAATGIMHIREGDNFRMGAMFGHNPGMVEYRKGSPLRPGRGSIAARAALTHQVEHILDIQADSEIDPDVKALTSNRTALAVPLLREDKLEGVFVLGRKRVDAFSQRQTELVQTFADQALIAIENARLFNEVQARTRELAKSLDDLRTAQDRLIQTEKLASLGQLTAGIAHEIKNPLNFVNNFSALSVDLIDELHTALTPVPLDAVVRTEVKEVTDLLRGNLEKVVQHGKRADGIVKNMLLHARESGGERRSVDLNATVDEALNLAYHGARAEKPGFTIMLERNFDPAVGSVELYPQEFTRVMLNLFSNGFYAATRKAGGVEFQPTLTVTTEAHRSEVLIRVRDNGTGIPDNARARLFEPFFTTKPAGEGTGLGLSLSHDIIVKQHGGSIAVDSRAGEYTEFTITLPRVNAEPPS